MTQNQIAYWSLQETKRSNAAKEKETNRSNLAVEKETNRHNVATELETNRHNVQTELLMSQSNAETLRHNQAVEMTNDFVAKEQQRSNLAQEELSGQRNAIAASQVSLGYAQLGETITHNRATEELNLMNVRETGRHNRENEYLEAGNLGVAQQNATTNFLNVGTGHSNASTRVDELQENRRQFEKSFPLRIADTVTSGIGNASKGIALLK